MKQLKRFSPLFFFCLGCFGQTQAPATADELKFFEYMLMNLTSSHHNPKAVQAFEDSLVRHFGLNNQESAVIHAAAQALDQRVQQFRQSSQAIVNGKPVLSSADVSSLAALRTERSQVIQTLCGQILNSVRPETAAKLRAPGHIMATLKKAP